MLLHIESVLDSQEALRCRETLEQAPWGNGRHVAGHSSTAIHNTQLPEDHPLAHELSDRIISSLDRNALFKGAVLPLRVFPPVFSRYGGGQGTDKTTDAAVRQVHGTRHLVRADLSATLFLTEPPEYEGGELVVEDAHGNHSAKLPAGHLVVYPAAAIHYVRPVVRGTRLAASFSIQSMIRGDAQRTLLFDLDMAMQKLTATEPDNPTANQLAGIYHNLMRMWAEV